MIKLKDVEKERDGQKERLKLLANDLMYYKDLVRLKKPEENRVREEPTKLKPSKIERQVTPTRAKKSSVTKSTSQTKLTQSTDPNSK